MGRWTRATRSNQSSWRSSGSRRSAARRSATNERSPPDATRTPIRPVRAPAMRRARTVTPSRSSWITSDRPAPSRPTEQMSCVLTPRRPSQRAVFAAEPPWRISTRPGTSVPLCTGTAATMTTSSMRSPTTMTLGAAPRGLEPLPLATDAPAHDADGSDGSAPWARSCKVRGYDAEHCGRCLQPPSIDHPRARAPRDQHDPDALDRCRPEGELRSSRGPDGPRAGGLRPVDALPAVRAAGPPVAEPRPVRALGRARLDAPLLAPPPDGVRPRARGPAAVPAMGLADAGPPGVRADAGRRGDDRPTRAGVHERRRHGDRGAPPRGRVQSPRPRGHRPSDLRDRLGR